MKRFRGVTLATALAFGAVIVVAQQPAAPAAQPAPQPPRPTFKTGTNYVRLDAYVTKDGTPVTDLGPGDFEVLEDGVPQKIDAFEYVRVQPAGPQTTRIEPNSQRDANDLAADPRRRVFVVYLDVDFVPVEGSHRLKTALAEFLSRVIGQDDLFAITTSRSDSADLIFARKTQYVEEQLEKYWYWGRRDTIVLTPEEEQYQSCYTSFVGGQEVANEMIDRQREVQTIRGMEDLVQHLRGVREERKAVLVISTGWKLFREDPALARVLETPGGGMSHPGPPRIGIGSGGKIAIGDDPRNRDPMYLCEKDRMMLAQIDNWTTFQQMLRDANRSNVSFYPVDPRGLVVFDTPIGPRAPLTPSQDSKQLTGRQDNIRWMANETDGLAVINQTDLQKGFRQIAADLTSYYLMGYYASNAALDGKYRKITVRVKRPGVVVRARKGYRAASQADVARGAALAASASGAAPGESAEKLALSQALGRLSLIRPDAQLALFATSGPTGEIWIAGELPSTASRTPAWANGGTASVIVTSADGQTVASSRASVAPGSRGFLARATVDAGAAAPARVQVRVAPGASDNPSARSSGLIDPATVTGQVSITTGEPLLMRKQGALAPRPVADFRFFRTEDLVFRDPVDAKVKGGSARVLDRNGQPLAALAIPVTLESGADGSWLTGTLRLAPLTSGDYALELTREPGGKVLVPFRVTR